MFPVDKSVFHWMMCLVFLVFIHWIGIYPVDRALRHLNNLGQMSFFCLDSRNVTLLAQGYYGATDGKQRTFEKV